MAQDFDRLQKISEKIRKLEELKRKLERRLKKEKKLAYEYAKETIFWYSLFNPKTPESISALLKKLEEVLCKRAKNKEKCLKQKLELISKHLEYELPKMVALRILKYIEAQNIEKQKES